GEQCVIKCVVLENVGEETGDDYAKSAIYDGPGRVFPTTPTSEVLTGDENFTGIRRIVENKILGIAFAVITPIAEEILAEALTRCCFQKTCRDDLVSIYIFYWQRNCRAFQ